MAAAGPGILLFRRRNGELQVLLVHPGGPFRGARVLGALSNPKGEYRGEDPLAAARREFAEELGSPAPHGRMIDLGHVRLKSGKLVRAWGLEGDLDAAAAHRNTW